MYPRFLAISAAIFLLSPIHALVTTSSPASGLAQTDLLTSKLDTITTNAANLKRRSKMDLTGPRFGLPATSEKTAVSRSNFVQRDFLGFLTGGNSLGPKQQTTNSGNAGYNVGGNSGYSYRQPRPENDEGGDNGDRQAGDMFDEGDDKPDHNYFGGGEAKKRSILGVLMKKPASTGNGNDDGDDEGDNGKEAKRSLKARRRDLARRGMKRSMKGTVFNAEMGVDSTVQDTEKVVNDALSHTQSTFNSAASDLTSHGLSNAVGTASSASPLNSKAAKDSSKGTSSDSTAQNKDSEDQSTGKGQASSNSNQSPVEDVQSTGDGQSTGQDNQSLSSDDLAAQKVSYYNSGSNFNNQYFG